MPRHSARLPSAYLLVSNCLAYDPYQLLGGVPLPTVGTPPLPSLGTPPLPTVGRLGPAGSTRGSAPYQAGYRAAKYAAPDVPPAFLLSSLVGGFTPYNPQRIPTPDEVAKLLEVNRHG